MSLTRTIAYNTLAHAGGKTAGILIGIATVAVMTRYLGQAGFGAFSTITAFVQLASVFGGLGLYLVTLRMLGDSEHAERHVFSSIMSLRLLSGTLMVGIVAVIVWFFPYSRAIHLGIIIYSVTALANMLDQIAVAGLQKHLSVARTALAEISGKILILCAVVVTVLFDLGLMAVLIGYVLGSVTHMTINMRRVYTFIPFRLSLDARLWRHIMRMSLPLAVSNIFTIIYFKADTIFLSIYRPQAEVGIYGAPYQALETIISFVPIFMGLVMPHLAAAVSDAREFGRIFQKAFDALLTIAAFAIAVVIPLASSLIMLIAGPAFAPSAPVLRILIVATGIIYLAHLTTYAVTALDHQKKMLIYYGIAAVGAVVAYSTLIPHYSYWAAAWTTVAVELFILISSYSVIKKSISLSLTFKNALSISYAATVTFILVWLMRKQSLVITLPAAVLIYSAGLHLLGVVKMTDIKNLLMPVSK